MRLFLAISSFWYLAMVTCWSWMALSFSLQMFSNATRSSLGFVSGFSEYLLYPAMPPSRHPLSYAALSFDGSNLFLSSSTFASASSSFISFSRLPSTRPSLNASWSMDWTAGDLRSRPDRDMISENEEISGSRGRDLLDAGEIGAAADGCVTVESITSLGGSEATAGGGGTGGGGDGSAYWRGTGDSVASVVERDDEIPGSVDKCCWGSVFG